jgi:hypothetical protein
VAEIYEHPRLIEESMREYLLGLDPRPWGTSLTGSGDPAVPRIYAGENNLLKDGQNIVAFVEGDLGDEDPPMSGNRWADLIVRLKTPARISAAGTEVEGLEEHQLMAAALQKAILGDGTDAGNITCETLAARLSAAVDDFTCFGITNRMPFRAQDDSGWVSGWTLRLYSCPSAIPG